MWLLLYLRRYDTGNGNSESIDTATKVAPHIHAKFGACMWPWMRCDRNGSHVFPVVSPHMWVRSLQL